MWLQNTHFTECKHDNGRFSKWNVYAQHLQTIGFGRSNEITYRRIKRGNWKNWNAHCACVCIALHILRLNHVQWLIENFAAIHGCSFIRSIGSPFRSFFRNRTHIWKYENITAQSFSQLSEFAWIECFGSKHFVIHCMTNALEKVEKASKTRDF